MRIIILIFFFALAAKTNAQTILQDTVEWTAVKAVRQSDNSEVIYNSSFVSNSNSSVDWVQTGVSTHYTVDQVQGTWASLANDGSIVYQISTPWGVTGTITFAKSQGNTTIHLQTQVEGGDGLNFIFQISTLQTR